MVERTAMFIDIQGFSTLYAPNTESDSLWGLSELMEGAFRLGRESPRLGISRLFIYHIGDGFVLVDDGGLANVNRLIGVAVALHQFTLYRSGHFCASAISKGGMADVTGCYPKVVIEAQKQHGVVPLGDGLMTVFPVMGTAIINTNRLLKEAKAAVILAPAEQTTGLDSGISTTTEGELRYVDWLTSASPVITTARQLLGIDHVDTAELNRLFDVAIAKNRCPNRWVERTSYFLRRNSSPLPQ